MTSSSSSCSRASLVPIRMTSKATPVVPEVINLDGDQFTVGRSVDSNFVILSPVISRIHAMFYRHKEWTIEDKKSMNGVFVNGKRLEPHVPYPVKEGDVISFGVPSEEEEFSFTFKKLQIEDEKVDDRDDDFDNVDVDVGKGNERLSKKRRLKESDEWEEMKKEKERLEEEVRKMKEELEEKRKNEDELKEQLAEQKRKMENELENEKQLFDKMWIKFEEGLPEFEKNIKAQVSMEQSCLEDDSQWSESGSQYERDELQKSNKIRKENLKKIQQLLKLKETKPKNSNQPSTKEFAGVLEMELECCICCEIIFQAVVLDCSHSFCSFCINDWKKRMNWCPVCRTTIRNFSRSVVIDSIVDFVMSMWSPEQKSKRQMLIDQRTIKRKK